MKTRPAQLSPWVVSLTLACSFGCAGQGPATTQLDRNMYRPLKESTLVKVPVVTSPETVRTIEKGATLVITEIEGECRDEVQDALMQRMIDNVDYDVLTRRYLEQILVENRQGSDDPQSGSVKTWEGDFNDDTGAQIGELLRASQHIVGKVVYCGPTFETDADGNVIEETTIIALLQILDLSTGKVLLSTAAEGSYSPRDTPMLLPVKAVPESLEEDLAEEIAEIPEDPLETEEQAQAGDETEKGRLGAIKDWVRKQMAARKVQARRASLGQLQSVPRIKAAEDLADGFARKFFSRPTWEEVEMWDGSDWSYGASVRYIKLGQCPTAVRLLEEASLVEVSKMSDFEVGEHLHNFGVALLCSNRPKDAMKKLRAAYRLNYSPSTLDMISLGSKILEWRLQVEVDAEPEIELLMERIHTSQASAR